MKNFGEKRLIFRQAETPDWGSDGMTERLLQEAARKKGESVDPEEPVEEVKKRGEDLVQGKIDTAEKRWEKRSRERVDELLEKSQPAREERWGEYKETKRYKRDKAWTQKLRESRKTREMQKRKLGIRVGKDEKSRWQRVRAEINEGVSFKEVLTLGMALDNPEDYDVEEVIQFAMQHAALNKDIPKYAEEILTVLGKKKGMKYLVLAFAPLGFSEDLLKDLEKLSKSDFFREDREVRSFVEDELIGLFYSAYKDVPYRVKFTTAGRRYYVLADGGYKKRQKLADAVYRHLELFERALSKSYVRESDRPLARMVRRLISFRDDQKN